MSSGDDRGGNSWWSNLASTVSPAASVITPHLDVQTISVRSPATLTAS